MTDRSLDRVGNLSIGQMRRIEIARALLHQPRLLLLDEPTVGLDIKARADILDHVRRLSTMEGIGVLWATHLIDEASAGDDVVVLHKGKILAHGALGELVGSAGGADLRDAFNRLTGAADQGELESTGMTAGGVATDEHSFTLAQYFICLKGIVWREALRFIHQRERFVSALVRPLVWLFIFAAGFRQVLGAVDHPALRDLCALRGLHRARTDRDDPAFQRHAIVAYHGL